MTKLILSITAFLVASRLVIENQPILGPAGLLDAVKRLDITALTPAIIHAEHLLAGMLFGLGIGLLYARSDTKPRHLGLFALSCAVAVTVFEVAIFKLRG